MELILDEVRLLTHVRTAADVADADDEWFENDAKAKRIIAEGLSSMHLEYIKCKPTANQAWMNLCATFEGKKAINRVYAFMQLFEIKYDKSRELQQFFKEFDQLLNEYKTAGGNLPELDVVTILLSKVSHEFKTVVIALQTLPEEEQTMDRIRTRLLEEELHSKGNGNADLSSDTKAAMQAKSKRCFICDSPNHLADKCPQRQRKNQGFNEKKSYQKPRRNRAEGHALLLTKNHQGNDVSVKFVLDSGCSDHLTNDISLISDVHNISPFQVNVAKKGQT